MCLSENSQSDGPVEAKDSFQRRPKSRTCPTIHAPANLLSRALAGACCSNGRDIGQVDAVCARPYRIICGRLNVTRSVRKPVRNAVAKRSQADRPGRRSPSALFAVWAVVGVEGMVRTMPGVALSEELLGPAGGSSGGTDALWWMNACDGSRGNPARDFDCPAPPERPDEGGAGHVLDRQGLHPAPVAPRPRPKTWPLASPAWRAGRPPVTTGSHPGQVNGRLGLSDKPRAIIAEI